MFLVQFKISKLRELTKIIRKLSFQTKLGSQSSILYFLQTIFFDIICGYFPKGFFPNNNVPIKNFPKCQLPKCLISQTATSQGCPNCTAWPLAFSCRSAWPLCSLQRPRSPNLTFGKMFLEKYNYPLLSHTQICSIEIHSFVVI